MYYIDSIRCMLYNLLKRDKKLVLISGMSGVGKTRIVYETYKESKDVYYLPYSCDYNDISNLTIRLNSGVIIIDNATNNDIINSKKIRFTRNGSWIIGW